MTYNHNERDHIATLRKRARWLKHRTAENPALSFDRTELKAIEWALRQIDAARGPLPDEDEEAAGA